MPFNLLFKNTGKTQNQGLPPQENSAASQPVPPGPSTVSDDDPAPSVQTLLTEDPGQPFYEKDNRALRIQRLGQAEDFWSAYETKRPGVAYLRYAFDTRLQAIDALESLSCVHPARDTGLLICTETVTLGCYRTKDGSYEVFLAGENLSRQTWSEATENFPAHRGRYRSQHTPDSTEKAPPPTPASQSVVFKKEYYLLDMSRTQYYRIFEAPGRETARAFLWRRENNISHRDHTILVETPDGTFSRDINGIHEDSDRENSG